MNNLNDLRRALVTVFVRYRQSQPLTHKTSTSYAEWTDVKKEDASMPDLMPESTPHPEAKKESIELSEQQHVDEVLTQTANERLQSLSMLIAESTQQHETRRTLLLYLQHVVQLLDENEQSADDCTFENNAHDEVMQSSLVALLNNLRILYRTTQYQCIPVTYASQTVNLWGFSLSNSKIALHIQALILKPLKITATTEEDIPELQVNRLLLKQKLAIASEIQTKNRRVLEENTTLRDKLHISEENLRLQQEKPELPTPLLNATTTLSKVVTQQPMMLRKTTAFKPWPSNSVHGFSFFQTLLKLSKRDFEDEEELAEDDDDKQSDSSNECSPR